MAALGHPLLTAAPGRPAARLTLLKRCPVCGTFKSRYLFGTQKQRPDGLNPYCKECKNRLAREAAVALVAKRGDGVEFQRPKKCIRCLETKAPSEFRADRRRFDGLCPYCSECSRELDHAQYHKNKQDNAWVEKSYGFGKKRRDNLRAQIISYYSNGANECACCGDRHVEFLAIDHINGGGRKHRDEVKNIYSWLRRTGFPDGFRVLCHNCNMALGLYGYCPHETEKSVGTAGAIDLASGTLRASCWQH